MERDAAFSFVAALLELGVLFLEARRIEEDDLSDIAGGFSAVNTAAEAVFDQFGDEAGVVDVGMGDQDGINAVRWNRERLPVTFAVGAFLIESAIDEDTGLVGFKEVTGAGNVARRAEEGQFDFQSDASGLFPL